MWNNDKCRCENPRKRHVYKKCFIWNPSTCTWEITKNLRSIIRDLVITCHEIIEGVQSETSAMQGARAKSDNKVTKTVSFMKKCSNKF